MAYKIYEGSPPALLQKQGTELLLVCFHELLRRRFCVLRVFEVFRFIGARQGSSLAAGAAVPAAGAAPR